MADTVEMTKFKKQVKELKAMKGQGTELVSYYIPPKYPIGEVTGQLNDEISQSANIKSARTKKMVQGALSRVLQFLKTINYKIPENGLAIFSGAIVRDVGGEKIELFHVVPPEPIISRRYRCDSHFNLEPLEDMVEDKDTYAIVVIDLKDATLALLRGKRYKIVYKSHSQVPGKMRAGGQSAPRFQRLRALETHNFYKKISEKMNEIFYPLGKDLKGVIIGGPGGTKEDFMAEGLIHTEVKAKFLGYVNTGYTDENGIREVINNSEGLLREAAITQEKKLIANFMEQVVKKGLATYGPKEVEEALNQGQVQLLLLSEASTWVRLTQKCAKCSTERVKVVRDKANASTCDKCDSPDLKTLEEEDFAEYLTKLAKKFGTKIETVSDETEEGKSFLVAFGGIGAILRYK